MSDVINKNKYLDLVGLKKYDELIKAFILSGNSALSDAIGALSAKIGEFDIEGSDSKSISDAIVEIYASIADIIESQETLKTDLESADVDLATRIQKVADDLESLIGVNSDDDTTISEINDALKSVQEELKEIKISVAAAVDSASAAVATAGEAKDIAEQANATAGEAKGIAEQANTTAGEAKNIANEANATAGEAKGIAEQANATAGEAKGIAEQANTTAGEAKDIANEANDASKSNADAIDKLGERISTIEGISNVAEVKYDEEDGYIKLYDKDGLQIGEGFDASKFVVDGMLESVDFKEVDGVKTNILIFTFNTDHGSDAIEIDFSKYIDMYHADETSITLNSDNKTFSIKEVAANKTKLGQKITIAGGPLANNIAESGEVWPSKWTNGTEKFIPEDATMYDIVMNLFCVEKWPVKSNGSSNVSTSSATLVSTMDTPTLTYNGKSANNNSTTVEVGTTVSYEANSGKSGYTATPHKASGFTYGYADANDDTKDSANTSKSASFGTISAVEDSIPTLTLSGKVSETIEGTAATDTAGAASKSGSVVIELGDNKIKAQGKSITYTGTCSSLPVYYGCSNLGNTNNDGTTYPSTAKDEVTLTSTAVDSGSIEINCVGAYQVFVGYTADIPTTSAGVRTMNKNNRLGKGSCGTTDTVYTIDNNYMVVAVPTGWDFTIQNDLGQADQRNSFSKSDSVVLVQLPNHTEEAPSTVSYDIWSIGWNGGAYKNLIIK